MTPILLGIGVVALLLAFLFGYSLGRYGGYSEGVEAMRPWNGWNN